MKKKQNKTKKQKTAWDVQNPQKQNLQKFFCLQYTRQLIIVYTLQMCDPSY